MDLKTFTEHMWPYWILGVMVMSMVIAAGQKELLRVEKKPLIKWIAFLGGITLWRVFLFKLAKFSGVGEGSHQITSLPWPVAFTVFWEDACHGLPLVILGKLLKKTKLNRVILFLATLLVMIEFGLGHTYQGLLAATLLSFYVPYTVKKGEQYGFGTIMICHSLYDLVTLITVKYLMGM